MKKITSKLVWHEVIWQRPLKEDNARDLLSSLAAQANHGTVVWEARGLRGKIRYLLGTEPAHTAQVVSLLKTHGNAQCNPVDESSREEIRLAIKVKKNKPALPLNTDLTEAAVRTILAAIVNNSRDKTICMQIVLGRSIRPSPLPVNQPDPHATWLDLVLNGITPAPAESLKALKDKAGKYQFLSIIRIGTADETGGSDIRAVLDGLRILQGAGIKIWGEDTKADHINNPLGYASFTPQFTRLSVNELVPLALFPTGDSELLGVPGIHPKMLYPPDFYKEPKNRQEDRTFATSLEANPKRLSISPEDAKYHTVLMGPTGCGKSTLMTHLILADIKAGRSVMVIDPKSDLIRDIMERLDEKRKEDVVVIDASDDNVVGVNPFRIKGSSPEQIADMILAIFEQIFATSWGVRSADVLNAALRTLANIDGATLLWIIPLLTDDAFRHRITKNIKDINLLQFWNQYDTLSERERTTIISPVLNKMRTLTTRHGLRATFGQGHPRFDIADLFNKRMVVLVPLNKATIGASSARLLGSLLVGMVWTLTLSRTRILQEERYTTSLMIDELQDYIALPTDFADALAGARGLGLALTVAHQYRGQLSAYPAIKSGIDSNARNKIIFGLGAADAREMASEAPELEPQDFMLLPKHEIYTNFLVDGKRTGWIRAKTLPPTKPIRTAAELKACSQQRYGVPTCQVEEEYLRAIGAYHNAPNRGYSDRNGMSNNASEDGNYLNKNLDNNSNENGENINDNISETKIGRRKIR